MCGTAENSNNRLHSPTDPDRARVVETWPALPEPFRRAVLALIGTTRGV